MKRILATVLANLVALPARAAVFGDAPRSGTQYTVDRVFNIVVGVACYVSRLALFLIVGAMFVYALQIALSGGSTSWYATGKKSFWYTVLGALVILGTYVIIATVANAVGASISPIPLNCSSS